MKHLKQLVRNLIDPSRDLGHVDRHSKVGAASKDKSSDDRKPAPGLEADSSGDKHGLSTNITGMSIAIESNVATGPLENDEKQDSAAGKGAVCEDCQ